MTMTPALSTSQLNQIESVATPLSPEIKVEAQALDAPSYSTGVKDEVGTPLLTVSQDFDELSLDAELSHHFPHYNLYDDQQHFVPAPERVKPKLTIPPSPRSFSSRTPPTVQAHAHLNSPQQPTLYPPPRHPTRQTESSHGFPHLLNACTPHVAQPDNSSRFGHSSQTSPQLSNYDSITPLSNRPRTSTQPVFHSTSDLAAHHGIPQSLPPIPRVSRPPESPAASSSSPINNDFDFTSLRANYLTMLSQNPEESSPIMATAPIVPSTSASEAELAQALLQIIEASPEFQMANEFLTSPMVEDASPWEDILATPALGSDDIASEFLTSPAIVDAEEFADFSGWPLFGDQPAYSAVPPTIKAPSSVSAPSNALSGFNLDAMYTLPSPTTPALDPSSLHPSPNIDADSLAAPSTPSASRSIAALPRRKGQPTGTRKNVTPESLVPYDAPVQARRYVTPSSTSRKEVPAIFARKRSRLRAFGEADEDQLEEDALGAPPTSNELDAIEAKRRQNTLAARRSRKRKLEYQRELEEGMEKERQEKEKWRARSQLLEALLATHGHEVPPLSR